ncbi:MAG: hypothetical protein ACRC2V_04085 [Xenococcaceae cyanobacterium]
MPTNDDFIVKLFKVNVKINQQKFNQIDRELKANTEKLNEIEELFIKHSRRSLDNSQILLFLVFGLFISLLLLALLGTSIEGHIGNSKINYSANSFLQVILTIATAGGGGVAIAQIQKFKKK